MIKDHFYDDIQVLDHDACSLSASVFALSLLCSMQSTF